MIEGHRITDPSDLDSITLLISDLNLESSAETSATLPQNDHHTTLALLQPLAKADMFAACRDPDSKFIRDAHGNNLGPRNQEVLNLTPLSLSWRQQLLKVAPFTRLTFDLRLPETDSATNTVPEMAWISTMVAQPGIFIEQQQVMNIAIIIATTMRLRAKCTVQYTLIYDKDEGPRIDSMEGLRKSLNNLANYIHRDKNKEIAEARKKCRICNPDKINNVNKIEGASTSSAPGQTIDAGKETKDSQS